MAAATLIAFAIALTAQVAAAQPIAPEPGPVPLSRALMNEERNAPNAPAGRPVAGPARQPQAVTPRVERRIEAHQAPDDQRLYPLLDPPMASGVPIPVTATVRIINLSEINEVAETFHVDAYLMMHWRDARLAYAPDPASPGVRVYRIGEIWVPTVELINETEPRDRSDAAVRVTPNGTVYYVERFAATITSAFALRRFPFDRQLLVMIIHPFIGDLGQVIFTEDPHPIVTSREFHLYSSLASWQLEGVRSHVLQVQLPNGMTISEINFRINVRRKYKFYIWKVIVPLLLMVALSWMVFAIEPGDLGNQLQIAVTTVLTVIAFGFAIAGNLPRVPYLTYIDAFFLCCYIFVFLAIVELMAVHVAHRGPTPQHAQQIRRVARWGVPAAFVISNAYLLWEFRIL
jgi:neurotransmitter-gated ion-channel